MHWAMPKKEYMLEGEHDLQQTDLASGESRHSSSTDVDMNFIKNGNSISVTIGMNLILVDHSQTK